MQQQWEIPGVARAMRACLMLGLPAAAPAATTAAAAAAVRSAKFIARKQWMVCGADDMQLRVYNYNTMDKVKTFEAHTDYIRSVWGGGLDPKP